jgi:RNA polymerase sigma factor (sigma-70 family)
LHDPKRSSLNLNADQRRLFDQHQDLINFVTAPYVRAYSSKFGISRDEFRQAARIGLAAAANKFDPSRGVPFAPFARVKMKHHCNDVLALSGGSAGMAAVRDARVHTLAYDKPVVTRTGKLTTRGAIAEKRLGGRAAQAEIATLAELSRLVEVREAITRLETLTPVERKVLRLRFLEGLDRMATARRLRCSGTHVRRVQYRAVVKLRLHFAGKGALAPDLPMPASGG